MLYIAYFIIVSGHNIKKMFCKIFHSSPIEGGKLLEQFVHTPKAMEPPTNSNSIAFGKSTSQRIYREQHTPKIGWKLHKYRLKHALHTLDDHFR